MSQTIKLQLNNINCASCVKTIETALLQLPEVEKAQVNFAEKTAVITGLATPKQLITAIEAVGYKAKLYDKQTTEEAKQQEFLHYRQLLRKAIVAGFFGAGIYLINMLNLLPTLTTPKGQIIWFGIGLLTLLVMIYTGGYLYRNAGKAFLANHATMDTLIATGTATAWIFSQFITVFPNVVPALAQHVYFEAALFIIALVNLVPLWKYEREEKHLKP